MNHFDRYLLTFLSSPYNSGLDDISFVSMRLSLGGGTGIGSAFGIGLINIKDAVATTAAAIQINNMVAFCLFIRCYLQE
jgi:hypothetical protein